MLILIMTVFIVMLLIMVVFFMIFFVNRHGHVVRHMFGMKFVLFLDIMFVFRKRDILKWTICEMLAKVCYQH